jgi:hypothetical protein
MEENEMKRLLLTLIASVAILAAPAMAQEKKLKIGATTYGLNAEFMQLWSAALKQHPAVKSGEVELTVFDGRYDALVQQEQFNTMITQKFDAIIFVPMDVEAGAAAVQAAHDAGIPVVGSNARVNSDLLTSYVGSNDVQAGEMEAKAVLDKMGCKGNLVILEGPIGQSGQIQRLEGNEKALKACPDVKVLEDPDSQLVACRSSDADGELADIASWPDQRHHRSERRNGIGCDRSHQGGEPECCGLRHCRRRWCDRRYRRRQGRPDGIHPAGRQCSGAGRDGYRHQGSNGRTTSRNPPSGPSIQR